MYKHDFNSQLPRARRALRALSSISLQNVLSICGMKLTRSSVKTKITYISISLTVMSFPLFKEKCLCSVLYSCTWHGHLVFPWLVEDKYCDSSTEFLCRFSVHKTYSNGADFDSIIYDVNSYKWKLYKKRLSYIWWSLCCTVLMYQFSGFHSPLTEMSEREQQQKMIRLEYTERLA